MGAKGRETYFEFTQLGQQMRVAAIDSVTGTEVVIIAPLTATRSQMQAVAMAKLRRRMAETAAAPARR